MITSELARDLRAVALEKNISPDVLIDVLQQAMVAAARTWRANSSPTGPPQGSTPNKSISSGFAASTTPSALHAQAGTPISASASATKSGVVDTRYLGNIVGRS